ncbi:PadR family transcriptional regulator [Rhodococcus sp. D2-41]|uniref:PadR family transcriptional regulator n=1 Tax=Speluncibacter jeojiensis TaxID=2710754 RepID=A0A9X4LXW8_9ACTN|nr:PadR family transcriptional regulator [Rhodococcus sp. D2-41]MDG3011894.1 PadR family transcriptional regulator [Rhodococcus sp. D2-41]MDG3013345.1 PadR family transcriptional regulator [Corynebacteriales bacterium D3-21]
MLSFGEALTGNDLRKWAGNSISYFYWSPSVSQIYSELKKLESLELVSSQSVSEPGSRSKRVYEITPAGVVAVRSWANNAPVELPVLKHGVMLRLWLGHLCEPERLKEMVRAHIDNLVEIRDRARRQAQRSVDEPAWAYPTLSLRWSERYFQAEIDLANALLADIDESAAIVGGVEHTESGLPVPVHLGSWRDADER